MKHGYLLAAALGAALLSSPAAAQSDHGRMDRDRAMSHHDMLHDSGVRMHGRMSQEHMARWCHSMSRHRMMMNSQCRAMMHMHRHHHDM